LFERVREWYDVFPWMRLVRTLRVAGSPPMVLLTFVCLGVWWFGQQQISSVVGQQVIDEQVVDEQVVDEQVVDEQVVGEIPRDGAGLVSLSAVSRPFVESAQVAFRTSPTSIYALTLKAHWLRWLFATVWTLLVWTPIALLVMRQGALLTAGRSMAGLREALGIAASRVPRAWMAALVPTLCVAVIALPIFLLGLAGTWVGKVELLETVAAMAMALIAILAGVLAFGAHFAVPLGWAAIATESNPDPLDSLSRGYEYLLRRPLSLVAYGLLSAILTLVVTALASGIASAAVVVVAGVLQYSGDSQPLLERTANILHWFPVAVAVTLAWGLVGGVYLLLRRDAGGQEVEDVWIPPSEPAPPLPSL
jgi:hypothetical protein